MRQALPRGVPVSSLTSPVRHSTRQTCLTLGSLSLPWRPWRVLISPHASHSKRKDDPLLYCNSIVLLFFTKYSVGKKNIGRSISILRQVL
ncbi:hypothetical protein CEXT_425261 [Caerostris extrusa]|uniref:Uncharacterized protein n=1 Tax=Caerostris extrusa TaxID=172846 RepID=A0AAV4UXT5_CAEEX|nr:hypothetical protein CEXT_425261 [Caerostris extrusa]